MSVDRLNEDLSAVHLADRFDRMLSQALQRHSEPVPAGFTAMVTRQLREAQQQCILARVVLQERLALAACITLAGLIILVAAVFPEIAAAAFRGITANLTEKAQYLIDGIPQAVKAASGQWGYPFLVAVFCFAVYSLVELLLGERATMA